MDTISSMDTMTEEEEVLQILEKGSIKEHLSQRLKNAPQVMLSGHRITIEIEELDEFYIQKAKEELRETPEIVAQSIKELKELIAGEINVRITDTDEFYTIFLRCCKWHAQKAFSLMKAICLFRQNYPHICTNLKPSRQKEALCSGLIYPMPLRNQDGSRIFVIEIGKRWKPKQISLDQIFIGLLLCTAAATMEPKTQVAGGHVIIDLEGLSLSQVSYFSPSFAKMVTDFIQTALPCRLKSINIVNQSFLFNVVFALFKPFLQEKLRKRIHFHGTNRQSLMAYVDKSALLKKHGGELDATDDSFGVNLWQLFCTFDSFFIILNHLGYINKV
ncbi:alpha-tocopherol transfer protein-like [Harpegnathos saltator]|uniref:alpha-tocopherol transfer protein-like n=1 Tax=Harpegnathos saltator TaxID=610380 RepID=UPI00058F1236|nr:alpha-tocopherol transfer protein-like [Harpegnathos saltator]XP_011150202.1 alpha-tocopherol transfer protein-like [Harpegnathos saltator]XP_011150203.1 alpha-tocopherol transfer protein-like [Harpegnathos saltator]XP_011150204.1 alpha-tocopherol transfer protein-like [Harpegnathos saltator]XP_011150205.1 alpha-tocopherol transfer protein-like [Harpegnathos saltator]XP_011150206.1 alpha-tocopherol transfer protein-like [Harpegnathos saltator]